MNIDVITAPTTTPPVEGLVDQFCGLVDALLEDGVHPHRVAEAALLASLPLFLEVTRASTIEGALLALASRFDGNDLRREH